jgi:hypothetical protein
VGREIIGEGGKKSRRGGVKENCTLFTSPIKPQLNSILL